MKASTRMRLSAALAALLLAAATIVPASGASATPKPSKVPVPGPSAPPKLPVLATAKFNPADAKASSGADRTGASVTINGFKADGQGLGVLYWTLHNDSAPGLNMKPGNFASERWGSSVIRPSGVNIVEGGERHATLVHTGGAEDGCLCYLNPPGIDYSSLGKGDEMQLSQVFAVSPQTKQITVEIPGFYPVKNIPVER